MQVNINRFFFFINHLSRVVSINPFAFVVPQTTRLPLCPYQQLQAVLDRRGAKEITILMGDFNTKIRMDNTGYEDIMGTHGLGQMNENGERFADPCTLNQLLIGGSIFPHKRIRKATQISPNHVTENQIDHICINCKFKRLWRDARVMRGADMSSDHHLMTTVRLRLKRFTNANSTQTRSGMSIG